MAIGTYYQALNESKPWYKGKKKNTIPGNDWQDIIGTMPSITGTQSNVDNPLSDYLNNILSGTPSMASEATEAKYTDALNTYFNEGVYKPTMTQFQQETVPAIKEEYVASGAITGTEVADKIAKETVKLEQSLAAQKAALAYQNFINMNPAMSDILQAALSYLNIPMMAAYQKPTDEYGNPIGSSGGWGSSKGWK